MSGPDLLFAIHCHQPVGNFAHVFRTAFADCYRPLLEGLERHPSFAFALHFSGPLWEYMEKNERGCWDLAGEMVRRGQAELLGGGFYEPVLTLIPEEDRLGQLRMMGDYLGERFGRRPRGAWLTERVWEPHLPRVLAAAGLEYTLLDEEHFRYAGVRDLHASYVTEDQGRPLRVFPIDKTLRYLIPFRPLEDLERYLGPLAASGGTAVLGDDGEKFGLWPGTHRWVYEEGWLERFLGFVEDRGVRPLHFSAYLDARPPNGRVYIPPASYEEMMEWVPEADHLHKRMVMVSEAVRAADAPAAVRADLYRAQCNDPYWHGVFGGLYLPHLREAAYRHLLEAEKGTPAPRDWRAFDYDGDGRAELFFRDASFGLAVKPDPGGTLLEVDHIPASRNLSDVLSRRREAYHRQAEAGPAGEGSGGKSIHELGKALPPGAEALLRYDRGPRRSLVDRFFAPGTAEEAFRNGAAEDSGDFGTGAFLYAVDGPVLGLERRGVLRTGDGPAPVSLRKTVEIAGASLRASIEIENLSDRPIEVLYGSEWNLLAFPHEMDFRVDAPGATLYAGALAFEPEGAAALWSYPLRTLSQSEGGFDIIHQGFCLCPVWPVRLAGKGTKRLTVTLKEPRVR
ncbi:MAG: DUF1926 domain-containing protein [Acidobacteria bacterium]|nr:DUF1926 domain-containing protein [Acidobacteriota bacterium]